MNSELMNPSDGFVQGIDIHTLLPQQEPFVMIDRLLHFDMKAVMTTFGIRQENMFVVRGTFSACGMLETVAQTCAARIGYINKYILGKGIQPGVIGAIRNTEILGLPKVGDNITTEIVIQEEALGMSLATATIRLRDNILATTEIKIAIIE